MKYENRLDGEIKAALQNQAAKVTVSPAQDEAVWQRLCGGEEAQTKRPVFFRLKAARLLTVFCALFCLSCAGVMAAGSALNGGWVGHSVMDSRFEDFAQAEAVVGKLDYNPQYVESLAGGWEFVQGHISEMQRLDENGQRMSHVYKKLFMEYQNQERGENICLVASNVPQDSQQPEGRVSLVGEIAVSYQTQPYKFVPPDYELTEDDLTALAEGSLEISVGTEQVERMLNSSVCWVQEGVAYSIFGWDLSLSGEEMLALAEDFIRQTGGLE